MKTEGREILGVKLQGVKYTTFLTGSLFEGFHCLNIALDSQRPAKIERFYSRLGYSHAQEIFSSKKYVNFEKSIFPEIL
jgi:hypothetical protein